MPVGSDEACRDIMSSQIVSNSDGYRYPTPEELEALSSSMQDVFATIQERTEGDKVVLYQVGPFAPEAINEGEQAVGRAVAEVARDAGIDVVMDKDEMQRVLNESIGQVQKEAVKATDNKFKEELDEQIKGTQAEGHVYEIGMPSAILLSTGFPNKPIQMRAKTLKDHSEAPRHSFNLEEVRDLVTAMQNPIAIFYYGDKNKAQNVILDIAQGEKHFLVGVHFNKDTNITEVSSIRGVFPKNSGEWLNWINQGKLLYADKEKIQNLIAQQRINPADLNYLDLDSAANVIKDFPNPKISPEILQKMTVWHGSPYVFEADAKIVNHTQFLRTSKGEVYGFVKDGKMYLDPERINPNTPLHEYGHLYDNSLMVNNPEMWARWKDLVRGTQVWNEVLADEAYADIAGDEDAVASEVKSRLTGQQGAERLRQMTEEAMAEPDMVKRAEKVSFVARVKELLRTMWEATKEWLAKSNVFTDKFTKEQIESMTVEDFINKTLDDLARGINPLEYGGKAEASAVEGEHNRYSIGRVGEPRGGRRKRAEDASPMIPGLFDDLGEKPTEADRKRVDDELAMDAIYTANEQRMADIEGELGDAESRLIDIKSEQEYNDSPLLTAERVSLEQKIEDLYDEYSGLQEFNGIARTARLYEVMEERQGALPEGETREEASRNVSEPLFVTRKLEPGEKCYVQRQFEEYKQFSFTGKEKIESVDDVAYIFKELEDAAVENAFAVLVKDGRPTIVHLGVGQFNSTQVNLQALQVAYDRMQPEKVYFIHNHPSGVLRASSEDFNMARMIARALNLSEGQFESLIIDTKSGKYGIFNPFTMDSEAVAKKAGVGEDAFPLKVYSFSKQVFDKDYDPERVSLTDAGTIAGFVSSQRLGERDKVNVLVFNNQLQVTANLFTTLKTIPKSEQALRALASKVAADAITFGGSQVVFYGDGVKGAKNSLTKLRDLMDAVRVRMVDAIEVKEDGGYNSFYNDEIAEGSSEYGLGKDKENRSTERGRALFQTATSSEDLNQTGTGRLSRSAVTQYGLLAKLKDNFYKAKKKLNNFAKDGYKLTSKVKNVNELIRRLATSLGLQNRSPKNNKSFYSDFAIETTSGKFRLSNHHGNGDLMSLGDFNQRVSVFVYDKKGEHKKDGSKPWKEFVFYPDTLTQKEIAEIEAKARAKGEELVVKPASQDEITQSVALMLDDMLEGRAAQDRSGKAVMKEYNSDPNEQRRDGDGKTSNGESVAAKKDTATALGEKLNTAMTVVEDVEQIVHADPKVQARRRRAKGWYDTRTGEVVVVLPNNRDAEDVAATIGHETVGHKGISRNRAKATKLGRLRQCLRH